MSTGIFLSPRIWEASGYNLIPEAHLSMLIGPICKYYDSKAHLMHSLTISITLYSHRFV